MVKLLKISVMTGDPRLPDPTKPGRRYNPEDFETQAALARALKSLDGCDAEVWDDHTRLADMLKTRPPDLAVNFCDTGFSNLAAREIHIPALLDLHQVPYTGATPAAMVLCYDKQVVRLVAEAQGVPVPGEHYLTAGTDRLPALYPALIKPNAADGSLGITKDAVVRDADQARRYLDWLWSTLPGRDALWQEYLPGTEYSIGVIGNPESGLRFLPTLEVDFSALPEGLNPILSYESKTIPDSPYWNDIQYRAARLPAALDRQMQDWVRILFKRFGLQDYGRFDFRCAADGSPRLMEVNPNPAWAYDGKLALMSGFAGIDYPGMLGLIIEAARTRLGI